MKILKNQTLAFFVQDFLEGREKKRGKSIFLEDVF